MKTTQSISEKELLQFIAVSTARHLNLDRPSMVRDQILAIPLKSEENDEEPFLFPRRVDDSDYYDRIEDK